MTKAKFTRRSFIAASAAAGATVGLISRSAHAAAKVPRVRGRIDIQVLDPGYMIGGMETPTTYATLPRLAVSVKGNEGWSWEPSDYVEALEQKDETHITFTLKPGLMWSNGFGEFTAEDVKYSFERILQSDWKNNWSALDHVEVTDKYSGVIVLNKPFAPVWLLALTHGVVGTIVCKAAVEKLPDKKFTTEMPAQCGPYTMTGWTPKRRLTLERNADWAGAKPDLDGVDIIMIEEDKSAELAYEAGELDTTEITVETYTRYKDNLPSGSKISIPDSPYYSWMGMNTEHAKLKDIRVRQAIQRAVDVDAILEAVYAGVSPKSYGVVTPSALGYRTNGGYSYDPDRARALLSEAGVSNLPLDVKVETNRQDLVTAAQIIQANLADVGINLSITPLDSGPFWNLGVESKGETWKTLELFLMQYRAQPDPSDAVQWFIKEQIGVWNWERWSDAEFEELWIKGLAESDAAERSKIYIRMQEIMENTGAYVWLTHAPLIFAHKDNVEPAFDASGYYYLNGFKMS